MKVKLSVPICGPEGNFGANDEVELSEKLATALIRDGHAVEIKEVKTPEENVKQILKENPALKQAFKETLDELKKPENVKKMADDITKVIKSVSAAKKSPQKKDSKK